MRYTIVLFLFLLLFVPFQANAMSRSCLQDCFATGHDCAYCAYQCDYTKFKNRYKYYREECFIDWDAAY